LEDELCLWTPGDESPNRLDALVWAFTELKLGSTFGVLEFFEEQARKQAEEKN
jgi:hypothetical protein